MMHVWSAKTANSSPPSSKPPAAPPSSPPSTSPTSSPHSQISPTSSTSSPPPPSPPTSPPALPSPSSPSPTPSSAPPTSSAAPHPPPPSLTSSATTSSYNTSLPPTSAASPPRGCPSNGLWYPKHDNFDLTGYADSDFGKDNLNAKSTTAGCQFFGTRLVTWQCKKQTTVALSTCEAEYISASSCCSQLLWIQQQMRDYGLQFLDTPLFVDNKAAIDITKNPVHHSRTKHIEIRYHFIRDCYEKKLVRVEKIHTDEQRADFYTKPFSLSRFKYLMRLNGIKSLSTGAEAEVEYGSDDEFS